MSLCTKKNKILKKTLCTGLVVGASVVAFGVVNSTLVPAQTKVST
jgi:hypothetical protein